MNECFHAKCGERAREASVCPACKHNNTDVSIHQVDPGKARRDLEKCLSRRHVVSKRSTAEGESLRSWAEKSVWSLVCAMELGLIPEPSPKPGPFHELEDDPTHGSSVKPHGFVSDQFLSIGSPITAASRPAQKPRGFASKKCSRKGRGGRDVWSSRDLDRAPSPTVQKFWKSCKRKVGRPKASPDPARNVPRPAAEKENALARENCVDAAPLVRRRRDEGKLTGKKRKRASRAKGNASEPLTPCDLANRKGRRTSSLASEFCPSTARVDSPPDLLANLLERSSTPFEQATALALAQTVSDGSKLSVDHRSNDSTADAEGSRRKSQRVGGASSKSTDSYSVSMIRESERVDSGGRNSCSPGANGSRNKSGCAQSRAGSSGNEGRASISKRAKDGVKTDTVRTKIPRMDEDYRDTRRITRGLTKSNKENFVGKLVWGCCSGWWPALIIDADHVGMLSEAGKSWVYWIGEARISLLNEKTHVESFSCNLKHRLTQNLNVARIRAIDATMQMLRTRLGCSLTKPYSTWIENNFSNMMEILDEMKFYPYPSRIQKRLDFLKEKNAKVTEKYLLDQKRENQTKKIAEKLKDSPPQPSDAELTRLPLKEQYAGVIAWAKITGHNWWPAMIIDYRDCCMREPSFGCQWIMWYGDYQLSEVHHQLFLRFDKGIEKMRDYANNTKKHAFLVGVLQASKDYCFRLGCDTDNWTLVDVFAYFASTDRELAVSNQPRRSDSVKIYDKYSGFIIKKLNEVKNDAKIDDKRANDIKNSDDLRSVISGKVGLESLCLKCLKVPDTELEAHPFFEGSLCKHCSEQYKPCMFVFGNDDKCFYCTVCAASGTVIICDKEDCPRVYCTACMKHLLCPITYDRVLQEDPWECFLCKSNAVSSSETILSPRANWKGKIIDMFRTKCNPNVRAIERCEEKRRIRVLSLFDGLSTGLLVLLKLGLAVDAYYASEIDQDALMVSASHFGDRIIHLGNVKDITKEKIKEISPIDLLIGGSPCNDLSLANPARLGLYDPKGTGVLFFEYCRIMKLAKKTNNGRRLFWMYENVASMPSEYRLAINKHLAQEPDVIDSADFSPQHRLRLYWHNLPIEPHALCSRGEQDVQDILTPHCQRYALVKKIRTVTTKVNSLKQGKLALKPILMKNESDSLWITELEEIFGFPRHYTDVKNLSATKRQRLIGKSWSVQTLTAILGSLCPLFQCNTNESR